MIDMFSKINLFKKALDFAWKRNEILSNNIANADTPGYKAKDVDFQSFITKITDGDDDIELLTTDDRHIKKSSLEDNPSVEEIDDSSMMRLDENSVDIEQEMGKLTKNSLYFDGVSMQLNRELNKWKNVIKEGR